MQLEEVLLLQRPVLLIYCSSQVRRVCYLHSFACIYVAYVLLLVDDGNPHSRNENKGKKIMNYQIK